MSARDGAQLNPSQVFDKGCAETRLREVTSQLIQQYVKEDLEKFALEYKKAFKPVPPYPLNESEIVEKFGYTAETEARKILEQERKNLVDFQSEYIKDVLERTIRKLRWLVYNGAEKVKIILDKEPSYRATSKDAPSMRDIMYFGDHDFERYEAFCRTRDVLEKFRDYRPYFNEELLGLWNEAMELSNLEVVEKAKEKESKETQA